MQMSFGELSRQINEKSHAIVPFPISKAQFQAAMDDFLQFLALPQEVKESIYLQLYPGNRGSEVGYKKYRRELGHTDNREYFHYHESADEHFKTQMKEHPELARLLSSMKSIYGEAKTVLEKIILSFEERFPGIHRDFFPEDALPDFFLRFLKYDCANPGEFLAKGHYDRGGCTLALAESAPGLRMGRTDQDVKEVVHDEGRALFMPGIKFHSVTSDEFPPTWHDVVQKGIDTYSDDVARWAIVFFAGTSAMRDVTYEEAHTPRY